MTTSEDGIAFIKRNEGFAPVPGVDVGGKPVWGYGHNQQLGDDPPASITEEEADALLRRDLATRFDPEVTRQAPWANQQQHDALSDFCLNLGPGALATMLHHGEDQVPTQIPAWCYMHVNGAAVQNAGLKARRLKEVAIFANGDYFYSPPPENVG